MKWAPEHDSKLCEYREQGLSHAETATAMNFWFEATDFTKDMVQKRYLALNPPSPLPTAPEPMPVFRSYFDEDGAPWAVAAKHNLPGYLHGLKLREGRVEILHTSDYHVDQHDEELVDEVYRRHCGADLLVLAGDFLDIYAYSRFDKLKNRPIEGELENGLRILRHAASTFPEIVVIQSNHLDRVSRAMNVPPGLGFLVQPNLMTHLALPFPNVHIVDDYYVQVGDAIFAHADYCNGFAPKSALQVHETLLARRATYQADLQPWRVVVQAHTHQVGSTVLNGVKLIESGCLAKLPLEYTTTAQSVRFGKKVQHNGYAVVVQKQGRSILNESREMYLESVGARRAA